MNGFTQYWKLTDAAFALNGVCDCLHNVEYKAEEISRISQLLRDVQKTLEGHADAIKLGSCDPEKDNCYAWYYALAGEKLGWPHLLGAAMGFCGVALLAFGRGLSFSESHALGYLLALGCAFAWSTYSVLSRRFGETPTDAIASFCAAAALLSLACHLLFERTAWPQGTTAWLAVLALGIGPTGGAFYLWDHAVKRGDIRALGALSYATPILSTGLLIVLGLAAPSGTLLVATLLVTAGAVLASRDLWKR